MESLKIIEILKQLDINLLLKPTIQKAVLDDLLYEYDTELKILNTVNNSVNVVDRLYKSKNKLLQSQSVKKDLVNVGLNENIVNWAVNIWLNVLNIHTVLEDKNEWNEQSAIKLSTGGSFTLALLPNNRLFSWGNNKWGQLGNGTVEDRLKPEEITKGFNFKPDEQICQISAAFRSGYVLTDMGRVFSFGNNEYGQIGDGTNINRVSPLEITSSFTLFKDERIAKLSTGGYHTLAITNFGRVFSFGNNTFGQLGNGTNNSVSSPEDISKQFVVMKGERPANIFTGLGHSFILTTLGRLLAFGNNEYGQLGDGSTNRKNKPVDITKNFRLSSSEKIQNVAVGSIHTLVLTTNNRVFSFGNNESGQLGNTSLEAKREPIEITSNFTLQIEEKVALLLAGKNYSLALTSFGRVFSWGNNKNGQLGINDFITNTTGPMDMTQKIVHNDNEWMINLFTGPNALHTYAISSAKKIYVWGNNEYGQIGEGTKIEKRSPIELSFQ